MPSIVRLRFVGDQPLSVPVLGRSVEPDCIVEFPGVTKDAPPDHPQDCVIVEFGNPPIERAFPHSLWRDETPAAPAKGE